MTKSLRARHRAKSQLRARFLREAQTQAQLEHPGIVPVYDLVHDDRGEPFFTMRAVTGTTLGEVLQARRDPTIELGQRYSTRALLAVFARVALTVAFAHERCFVHRDLNGRARAS